MINTLTQIISRIFVVVFVCIATTSIVFAQSDTQNLFSADNRLKFGNHLFCEKDYLRALGEYRYYLQQANNDTVRFKIALALAEMGRYDESLDNLKGLFYNSKLSEQAKLDFYRTSYLKNSGFTFRKLVESELYFPKVYSEPIKKLYSASLLSSGLVGDSLKIVSSFDVNELNRLTELYNRKKNPGYKDEDLAGILSAVLPGLGKVYSDEIGDGITSFLITGVLTYLAVNNFNNNHQFRGYVFTGLAAYFYAGNIYGSIAAAQNYNAAVKFRLDTDLNLFLSDNNWFVPKYNFICN